jgi:hypothetical protein
MDIFVTSQTGRECGPVIATDQPPDSVALDARSAGCVCVLFEVVEEGSEPAQGAPADRADAADGYG